MPVIKPACISDLKMRVNLVDVVARVATLRKAGSRFKGLCPFHTEKTPSFHVDPDKGFYKCFGCGKAGDLITFVRETEQLGFTEAVETLGRRFGIVIEYEEGSGPSREERSLRQEIFELHDQAAAFYQSAFRADDATGTFMRRYWTEERRFPAAVADEFQIGAAAPDGGGLGPFLLKKRFSESALRQCGLFFLRGDAAPGPDTLRPRFRGRLMIPIRDHQGRVVAFTARQTALTPEDDPSREAKYVNSPETPIFTKGHLLFNLDRARTAVGEGHPFLLVEGQLDAIRCWQSGIRTAVAPQGTAITETQLHLLRRYHAEVECLFDSDDAGSKAALRFLPMALRAGLEVRFLGGESEGKLDPDLLFAERGFEAYAELQRGARGAMDFACRAHLPAPEGASAEAKARTAQALFELVGAADSAIARSHFLAEVAAHLRLPLPAVEQDFLRGLRRHGQPTVSTPAPAPAAPSGITPEQNLLLLCLHFEDLGRPLSHSIPHGWIDRSHPAGILLERFLGEFDHGTWPGRDRLEPLLETPEERALVAGLLFETPDTDDPVKNVNQALTRLRERILAPRVRQIELDLANHHENSNADPISLAKELAELRRQLRQPIALVAVT